MTEPVRAQPPRTLILTVRHGSAHVRISQVLRQALLDLRPDLKVDVVNVLAHCRAWFRAYYNAFEIPLKYWPRLWEYIENRQHLSESTSPQWLYRWGAQPLFRFIESTDPDVVVATEVGLCEIAVLHKRQAKARYSLVGVGVLDFDRAWAQPEVDLFTSFPGEIAAQLKGLGVPQEKILQCGMPVDPAFGRCPDLPTLRDRLGLDRDIPLLLVNFGGTGKMNPRQVVPELRRIQRPVQLVFISRRDEKLRRELLRLTAGMPHVQVLGWVDNLPEWMAAADLLVGRAGGCTVAEALNSGLPLLVFGAPPGDEQRACELIENKWQTGYWAKRPQDIAPLINRMLAQPEELGRLRCNARRHAHPDAARDAAEAILMLCGPPHGSPLAKHSCG